MELPVISQRLSSHLTLFLLTHRSVKDSYRSELLSEEIYIQHPTPLMSEEHVEHIPLNNCLIGACA